MCSDHTEIASGAPIDGLDVSPTPRTAPPPPLSPYNGGAPAQGSGLPRRQATNVPTAMLLRCHAGVRRYRGGRDRRLEELSASSPLRTDPREPTDGRSAAAKGLAPPAGRISEPARHAPPSSRERSGPRPHPAWPEPAPPRPRRTIAAPAAGLLESPAGCSPAKVHPVAERDRPATSRARPCRDGHAHRRSRTQRSETSLVIRPPSHMLPSRRSENPNTAGSSRNRPPHLSAPSISQAKSPPHGTRPSGPCRTERTERRFMPRVAFDQQVVEGAQTAGCRRSAPGCFSAAPSGRANSASTWSSQRGIEHRIFRQSQHGGRDGADAGPRVQPSPVADKFAPPPPEKPVESRRTAWFSRTGRSPASAADKRP